MPAERCRAAVLDRRHHLQLAEADMTGLRLSPYRSMAAENIRDLQLWTYHARRVLGGRLVFGRRLVFLERREAIERAHDLADRVGGNARIERRRIQLRVTH
jgi:hypothetical protein